MLILTNMGAEGLFSFVRGLPQLGWWQLRPHGVSVQVPLVIPAEEQKSPSAVPKRKRKSIYDTITDTEMVEQVFGFLPSLTGGQDGPATPHIEVRWALPAQRRVLWGACPVPAFSQPLGFTEKARPGSGSEFCGRGRRCREERSEDLCGQPLLS